MLRVVAGGPSAGRGKEVFFPPPTVLFKRTVEGGKKNYKPFWRHERGQLMISCVVSSGDSLKRRRTSEGGQYDRGNQFRGACWGCEYPCVMGGMLGLRTRDGGHAGVVSTQGSVGL